MLNPFPELLVYSLLAPFILRVVVGLVFIDLGMLLFKGERKRWITSISLFKIPYPEKIVKVLGLIQILGGLALIVGFYTQIAALVLSIITLKETIIEYREPEILKRNLVFYILIFSITLSLIFSGAGAFAIDLPL